MNTTEYELVRYVHPRHCVVRVVSSGAFLDLSLSHSLSLEFSGKVHAWSGIPCRVELGPYHLQRFQDCKVYADPPTNAQDNIYERASYYRQRANKHPRL